MRKVFLMVLPQSLHDLRNMFLVSGFDIKLVGGCVRDSINHIESHDVDLCTDANPDQQKEIYQKNNVRHIDTGLQHGTWTVVLNDVTYEITSLRTETDCDGRHATVSYTRDWLLDLSRRDLTFNAMLMDFDGKITDPYNGRDDLANNVIRFVGDAGDRMREDYLRILRWYRFHARMSKGVFSEEDVFTTQAIMANMHGLQTISRERVWSEFKRLIVDHNGLTELASLIIAGVGQYIDLPVPCANTPYVSINRMERARKYTKDPVSLMAAYLGTQDQVNAVATNWRWSNTERDQATLIVSMLKREIDTIEEAKYAVAYQLVSPEWTAEALCVMGKPAIAAAIRLWSVPEFPVRGADLLKIGMKQGAAMGSCLSRLKEIWGASLYTALQDELLEVAWEYY